MKNIIALLLLLQLLDQNASAVEFEKLGTALGKALQSKKGVFQKSVGKDKIIYYTKGSSPRVAVVEKGVYPPNCTHTWVIALDPGSVRVNDIRVVEMSCHHAYPCQKSSFLAQYKGKGPADTAKLKEKADTIAKATGTSHLTSEAVVRSIETIKKHGKELK